MARNRSCPYCGQQSMSDDDPRMICTCYKARKYRRILEALDKQSTNAEPMKEIDSDVMEELKRFAHLICKLKVEGITVKLGDSTTVSISTKVARTARLKIEEKIDE